MSKQCYIFLGPPGAGKGTQAKLFCTDRALAHVSTGDMLRAAMEAGSELGKSVKEIVDSGKLVPDDLMVELIRDRIQQEDCNRGFVLDGFPRTTPQAEALAGLEAEGLLKIEAAVLFEISMDELRSRLASRRESEGRADDNEETQLKRIEVYNENTAPLIEYYTSKELLVKVPSNGSIEEVSQNLFSALY